MNITGLFSSTPTLNLSAIHEYNQERLFKYKRENPDTVVVFYNGLCKNFKHSVFFYDGDCEPVRNIDRDFADFKQTKNCLEYGHTCHPRGGELKAQDIVDGFAKCGVKAITAEVALNRDFSIRGIVEHTLGRTLTEDEKGFMELNRSRPSTVLGDDLLCLIAKSKDVFENSKIKVAKQKLIDTYGTFLIVPDKKAITTAKSQAGVLKIFQMISPKECEKYAFTGFKRDGQHIVVTDGKLLYLYENGGLFDMPDGVYNYVGDGFVPSTETAPFPDYRDVWPEADRLNQRLTISRSKAEQLTGIAKATNKFHELATMKWKGLNEKYSVAAHLFSVVLESLCKAGAGSIRIDYSDTYPVFIYTGYTGDEGYGIKVAACLMMCWDGDKYSLDISEYIL